ncbi:acylphosphatase [Crocosphaera sp. XPORK-15E]|uniref:acylphosphatase n=1 Tax=Crocosphaera sp. XPORK-15E TaxID=3110247 RepID=UPI002B1F662F|nr:acylphosphatase [Crocosphaera sp. XPORK-15E]MEA5534212.1 acylphosphatase [Crocosphaera sp. XPORK-15E]
MTNSDTIFVHVLINGKVQGVGYRYGTVQEARKLGIRGWVRNLADGRVEAVFVGDKPIIEQMVQWCHQGPRHAQVTDVDVKPLEPQLFQGFEVRETPS